MRWWRDLGPTDILTRTREPRTPSTIDAQALKAIGPGGVAWAHALAVDLAHRYVEHTIPELRQTADFSLGLTLSAEANVLSMLLALEDGESPVDAPAEAIAYAREAAARRTPLSAVLRGYRLGVEHWIRWCAPAIEARLPAGQQAEVLRRATQVAVRYGDKLSERVAEEYERELHDRAMVGAVRRAELVRALLADEPTDAERASRTLVYPLTGIHLAVALSLDPATGRAHAELEAVLRQVAERAGSTARLVIPSGLSGLHAWLAIPPGSPAIDSAEGRSGVFVGTGSAAEGVSGFRRSHVEARRALDVARLAAPGRLGTQVRFGDVSLLAALTEDMLAARHLVASELRGLGTSDARSRVLRATLLRFLQMNRSYQAVARVTHLHKNTVVKRVARAEHLIGRPVADRQLEIHTALLLADAFGDRVIKPDAGASSH